MPFSFPSSSNENARLAALDFLQILGTPRTPDFDSIVAMAAQVFSCPIGLVSLVAADKQWFKAEIGLGVSETPREVSFCNYTILETDLMIVEDATKDDRFRNNELVTGRPSIRFYAGVPINFGDGYKIGSLCVIDTVPRTFSEGEVSMLRYLGRIVEGLVDSHFHASQCLTLARTAEDRLRALSRKTQLLMQSERLAKIGSWHVDLINDVILWSEEVYRLHDLDVGTPLTLDMALAFYTPDSRGSVRSIIEDLIASGTPCQFEQEIETALGRRRWLKASGAREMQDGQVVAIFGIAQDVTEKRESERRLWEAANYDALTSIPNRFQWNAKLQDAFSAAHAGRHGLTMLILDLDGFKEINDTRGHAVGDAVLCEVARRLTASVSTGGFVARLGGDEFAVLLPGDITAASIERQAAGLLTDLRRPIYGDGVTMQISGTFGSATYPNDAETASGLMKAADIALYHAKRSRRSALVMYHRSIAGLFDEKCQAIELVNTALSEDRLVPFYQPKVDLVDGRTIGFEALVRIEASDGTILGPKHFMQALQDPGASSLIGARMLDLVTADLAVWRRRSLDVQCVALNLAESDFLLCDLPKRILSRLHELHLPTWSLQVEVTENVVFGREGDVIVDALQTMHSAGILIALDDFGTGFASLTHLRDLPLDFIKIDGSFVAAIGRATDSEIIMRSVIDLGHGLNKKIVAEGIETEAQAAFLRQLGCDFGQGFLFGRPVSRPEAELILEKTAAGSSAKLLRKASKSPTNRNGMRSRPSLCALP